MMSVFDSPSPGFLLQHGVDRDPRNPPDFGDIAARQAYLLRAYANGSFMHLGDWQDGQIAQGVRLEGQPSKEHGVHWIG